MHDYDALVQERTSHLKADTGYAQSCRKWQVWTAVIVAVLGTVGGGVMAGALLAVVGLVVGAVLGALLGTLFKRMRVGGEAEAGAKSQFMEARASDRGLTYTAEAPVHEDVPMLRQGERREANTRVARSSVA